MTAFIASDATLATRVRMHPARPVRSRRFTMGLLDKVKDAAGKAAEQAKHATEVGKEKLEDRKLSKQVETLLQEIGEIVVAQRRGTAAADADAQITAKIAEITELEAQIDANNVASGDGSATPPTS
jgi:hypothetical protein